MDSQLAEEDVGRGGRFVRVENDALEYLFSGYIRVQRGLDSPRDIYSTYRARLLKSVPRGFSERERSQLLDLPDPEIQQAAVQAATDLSQEELLLQCVYYRRDLSPSEAHVLVNRYWADVSTEEQLHKLGTTAEARRGHFPGYAKADPSRGKGMFISLDNVCGQLWKMYEAEAFDRAHLVHGPFTPETNAKFIAPGSRPWVHRWVADRLIPERSRSLDYVVYIDRQVQEQHRSVYDRFSDASTFRSNFYNAIYDAVEHIHADSVLIPSMAWTEVAEAPSVTKPGTIDPSRGHEKYMMREWPRNAEIDDHAIEQLREIFRTNRPSSYALHNVFLVVDPTCYNTVNPVYWTRSRNHPREWGKTEGIPWRDRMRILAVDPDYPRPQYVYPEGYKGYLWVRVQQLVDKFLEMRLLYPEVGMEQLWLAAKESKHEAFVSMDPEEAKNLTSSRHLHLSPRSLFYKIYYDTANEWVLV